MLRRLPTRAARPRLLAAAVAAAPRGRPAALLIRPLARATSSASGGAKPAPTGSAQAAAPWVVSPQKPDFESRAASSIHEHGFTILPGLLPPDMVEDLRKALVGNTDEVMAALASRGVELEVGSESGFREVCLRSPGRFDVPCSVEKLPRAAVEQISRLASRALVDESAGAGADARSVAEISSVCIVRGEPGCKPQIWHADSLHMESDHRPPNMLNVIVALDDVTPADGPTEIVPGSHVLTNHMRAGAAFDGGIVYQNNENSPQLIGSSVRPVAATMPKGSALIFDDRTLHRGGGNTSEKRRDLAVFSFCRAGYVPPAYYEATRSLQSYDHRSLAAAVRKEFPGLAGRPGGKSLSEAIFADGASGSQVHESAMAAMVEQMRLGVANMGGSYDSSRRVGETVVRARSAMADFLNCAADEIVFGPSMSALTYHVARSLRKGHLASGDNVVLDPISHGANVWPWVQLAKACNAEIRWLPVAGAGSSGAGECILDSRRDALAGVIDKRTRLVAAGAASNGVGSVHDVQSVCALAEELSSGQALRYIDAVHFAPHSRVDVASIGCDLLACSPYKFFGPHSGVLFGRRNWLASLPVDRLDCQDDGLPNDENCHMSRWELGTQNYEALAGMTAAVDYLAGVGLRFGGAYAATDRSEQLKAAWRAIEAHERELKIRFLEGSARIPGLQVLGVVDPARPEARTPTFAVAKDGYTSADLAEALCSHGVWCTAGNHYAGFWSELSGGLATVETGMARIGFLHYNTLEEIDSVLGVLEAL